MDEGAGSASEARISVARRMAIGCFTSWLGLVSGGMIFVLLSKFVAYVTHGPACDGIPSCNWYIYALVGAGIGAVTLPILVLWVLGKPTGPNAGNIFRG